MLHHSWDSPRNSHFDLPKLMLAREKSMYRELIPSGDSPNAQRPVTKHCHTFSFFCDPSETLLCRKSFGSVSRDRQDYSSMSKTRAGRPVHVPHAYD